MTTPSTRRDRSAASPEAAGSAGIGRVLKAARTERGVSLADLQGRTKIRVKFLAALEEERFEDLPPYPFTRGFLLTYARELGIDPEPLMARLATAMSGSAGPAPGDWRRLESAVVPAVPSSRLRRLLVSIGVMALVVASVLLILFARQWSEFNRPVPAVTPEAGAPGAVASALPQSEPSPAATTEGPAQPAAAPTSPGGQVRGEAGITLEVQASGRSWVLVTAGDQPLFVGFVTAGDTRRWQSRGPMTIRLGNAGVVEVNVNGKTVGVLGRSGEVVERTFTKDDTR